MVRKKSFIKPGYSKPVVGIIFKGHVLYTYYKEAAYGYYSVSGSILYTKYETLVTGSSLKQRTFVLSQ